MSDTSPSSQPRVQFWHHLNAPEIRRIAGEVVTILPIGSTEQHGPHLSTGTDTILNDLLQRGLAQTPPPRGRFLILPTLAVGSSEHHVAFGGTLTIPPILYTQVLVALVRTLIAQGHKRIFLLNSHGGNQPSMTTALAELADECTRQEVLVAGASYWSLCTEEWKAEVPDLKLPRVGHACEIETSLFKVARPDIPIGPAPEGVAFLPGQRAGCSYAVSFAGMTAPGHIGYPTEASQAKGEALLNTAVRVLGEFFAEFSELPLTRDLR